MRETVARSFSAPVVLEADERNRGGGHAADLARPNRPDLGTNFGGLLPYNSGVHSLVSPLWARSRGVAAPPGPFLYLTPIIYNPCQIVSTYDILFFA
jgi:hypothetical protein